MVGGDGEDQGSADHIRQYQPGPDGAEDEEGDLSGGRAEEVVVESVCDISLGADDDNGEDELNNAHWENEGGEIHHFKLSIEIER